MSTNKTPGFNEPSIDSRGQIRTGREVRRQDWGYTNQYRRMMQRDTRQSVEDQQISKGF
ncbi:hypothetical protein [Salinimicrobium terrae]|uniref:hypothetical protein n=1 Tax=Salinimicrobium terrae TaxID=470866 RepID=UPI00041DF743|nr:hypothetical protein [Salinimicrobium terrae]